MSYLFIDYSTGGSTQLLCRSTYVCVKEPGSPSICRRGRCLARNLFCLFRYNKFCYVLDIDNMYVKIHMCSKENTRDSLFLSSYI
jgi:hypothetical protein